MISVDILPGDVLLEMFKFHLYEDLSEKEREEAWQTLVHVCRRWRSIVFDSPRHLKLQLVCTHATPTRDMLDVWPSLPLIILCEGDYPKGSVDNIIAGLQRRDRVCQVILKDVWSSDWDILFAAMQEPFPELTRLEFWPNHETMPIIPDSILGGSAPRLEILQLGGVSFPGLPKLLLSATHLVSLHLYNIPHPGYISPDAVVTALSTLTSLDSIVLQFQSARSFPGRESRRPPPSTRSVLPVLTGFWFKGVTEYLEDLVARIDAPRLNALTVSLLNDIVFDTPHLIQFINRTPASKALEKARITLGDAASVNFSSQTSGYGTLNVDILCRGLDWQLSSLEQVFTSCLPPFSILEDLYLPHSLPDNPNRKDKIDNGLWQELLHPFIAVKNLHLSKDFALHIGPALQELVEGRTTEMLPALQNIFLEGFESSEPIQEGIGQFVAARQVAGYPIAVSRWDDKPF